MYTMCIYIYIYIYIYTIHIVTTNISTKANAAAQNEGTGLPDRGRIKSSSRDRELPAINFSSRPLGGKHTYAYYFG